MKVLLDTCTMIWAIAAPKELSKKAASVLRSPESECFFSPFSCAEVAWAVQSKRITIDRHWKSWFRHYVAINAWQEVPVNLDIVEEAYSLPEPFHADPVDRLLVATARLQGLHLMTGDAKILSYPHVRTIW